MTFHSWRMHWQASQSDQLSEGWEGKRGAGAVEGGGSLGGEGTKGLLGRGGEEAQAMAAASACSR